MMGTASHIDGSWGEFRGDDVTYPLEMCLHVIEMKARNKGWSDKEIIEDLLSVIPDTVTSKDEASYPSMIWKECFLEDHDVTSISWNGVKQDIQAVMKSSFKYTVFDKLHLLNTVVKKKNESVCDYLVRVICVVSLIQTGFIPESVEKLHTFHLNNRCWIKMLFLFGLATGELDSLMDIADTALVEQLSQMLSGQLVKVVDVDKDAIQEGGEIAHPLKMSVAHQKKLRAVHEMSTAQFIKAGLCQYCTLNLPAENHEEHTKKCSLGEGPYKCTECSHTSDSLYMRNHHVLKTHCLFEEFSCRICYKNSGSNAELQHHMAKEHNIPSSALRYNSAKKATKEKYVGKTCKEIMPNAAPHTLLVITAGDMKAKEKIASAREKLKRKICSNTEESPTEEKTSSQAEESHKQRTPIARDNNLDPNDFSCNYCNKIFRGKKYLDLHVASFHDTPSESARKKRKDLGLTCDFCSDPAVFETKADLVVHQKASHKEGRYECKCCSFNCSDYNGMIDHKCDPQFVLKATKWPLEEEKESKKANQHAIDCCKNVYAIKSHVVSRDDTDGAMIWSCHQCNIKKQSDTIESYALHVRNKHNGIFYHCHICTEPILMGTSRNGLESIDTNSHRNRYANHLLRKHTVLTEGYVHRSFLCHHKLETGEDCNFRSLSKTQFVDHWYTIHKRSQRESHLCSICGQSCLSKYGLKIHTERVHNKKERQLQFLCNICGLSCFDRGNLKKHTQTMHEPKTLICHLCPNGCDGAPKKLFNKFTLKSHMKDVHIKKGKCSECDYSAKDHCRIIHHYRSYHLKYLQYVCSACSKMFNQLDNAKYHYQSVHLSNRERKLDISFWASEDNRNLIENRQYTDPEYPTDEKIKEILREPKVLNEESQ